VQQLERHHRVLRVDNRGTGWSHRTPAPFTIADCADDVAAILDQCGLPSATVLGMSMGGMIAQEFGIRHPDRVARLILVSTIPPAPAHVPTLISAAAISATLSGTRSDDRFHAEGLARLYLNTSSPKFTASNELIAELADQLRARPTPMTKVIQQARAIAAWRDSERLLTLRVPTAIVVGQDDPVVKPINSHALAALVPEGRLHVLAGVGHMVPWEAPNRLTALING
jgi:pimeloyl-ACP methyl ester carboxylesterase